MATDASKVRVGVTGSVHVAPVGTAAPTGTASSLNVAFVEAGWIGEGGVTRSFPGSGDTTAIKGWQGGATIRVISAPSDDQPTFQFVMLEENKTAVETALGVTVTQTVSEGSYEIDITDTKPNKAFVFNVVDGSEILRDYVPEGYVSEVGDRVYANGEPIGWEVTVVANRNTTAGYNVKSWSTSLKS